MQTHAVPLDLGRHEDELRFAREKATPALFDELAPLVKEHYGELASFQDIPLDVAVSRYLAIEADGKLRIYVARDASGQFVGYSAFVLYNCTHAASSVRAIQDVIFLQKPFRGRGLGERLVVWCDEQLRADGVDVAYQVTKLSHDFGPMLESVGYTLVDKVYARRLKDG